jgi:hypothetical protein
LGRMVRLNQVQRERMTLKKLLTIAHAVVDKVGLMYI